jgi:hypothetical protein
MDTSRRYLKETPNPAFVNVQPEEFISWLSINERKTSDQFNRAEMDLVSSLNSRSQFFGAGDAFHVFPVIPDVSSREDSEHFWKILGCFRARLQDFSNIFCPGELHAALTT